jgi:broad specificity phosphatase PhoE
MKMRSVLGLLLFVALFTVADVTAQSNKTIVLVRHAEKVTVPPTDSDPDLSPEGRERAIKLMNAIKKYKPHEIFSTNYKRTRLTAEPTAKRRNKEIQTYDPAKQNELVEKIMASKTDHYLIVGHSNTIPALANLLAKKELFRNLLETEYGVFWVIRMKNGAVTRVEVFPY